MKKAVTALAVVSAVLVIGVAIAGGAAATEPDGTQEHPFGPGDKVAFCHYDGSDQEGHGGSGKYNTPEASTTATGPAGHIDHAFDVIPSYYFQQNANASVEFYAGVNWPTLNNLPSSPVDFTPLLGSSASAFIASGCGAPVTTSQPPPVTTTTEVPPPVTTTTEVPPPVTTTTEVPPPVTTTTSQPPPVTTSTVVPPPVTTSTSSAPPPPTTTTSQPPPPPTTTEVPPPPSHTNPPNNPPNERHAPPQVAFTGPENVVPIGAVALALLLFGAALLRYGRKVDEE